MLHRLHNKGQNYCSWAGSNLVAIAREKPLTFPGSEMWSDRFSRGPLPVTMACTKNPNMENIACKRKTVLAVCFTSLHCKCVHCSSPGTFSLNSHDKA